MKENSTIASFKIWVFPSLVSIMSLMIWNDVNEIKADVKALMAQSNIDKTRIDNLERLIFEKSTSSLPSTPIESRKIMYATLPEDKFRVVKYTNK